jgi:hypothetical protein
VNSNIHGYRHDNFKTHIPKPVLVKRHLIRPFVTQKRLLVLQTSPCLNGGKVQLSQFLAIIYNALTVATKQGVQQMQLPN